MRCTCCTVFRRNRRAASARRGRVPAARIKLQADDQARNELQQAIDQSRDVELIERRLKAAGADYEARYGQGK
jgi:hypothetical protein